MEFPNCRNFSIERKGNLRAATMAEEVAGPWRKSYLEPSSFDAPVEFIILTAPAPEAVGHAVALTQRQGASVTCRLLPEVYFGFLPLEKAQPKPEKSGSPFLFLP